MTLDVVESLHPSVHTAGPAGRLDPARIPVGVIGRSRLLIGLDHDLTYHAQHLRVHGALPRLTRDQLLAQLDRAGLTGRGGAAYPVAAKIRSLRPVPGAVVVVNGAEGEPASAKDHLLLARTPHVVLDGAALVADVVGACAVTVAVTDHRLVQILAVAASTRPDSLLFEVRLVRDRFLAGEAHALLSALGGGNGLPPGRRVHATDRGLGGAPTLLFNAETFAQLAILVRTPGGTSDTTLITVSGAVDRPGVLEVPLGISLGDVAATVSARPSQAVVVGGYHGTWLAPDPSMPLSIQGLAAAGGTFGAGVVAFVGQDTCPLAELAVVAHWLAAQSARQCGPCMFGLPAIADDLDALLAGRTGPEPFPATGGRLWTHAQQVSGRGACAHPDGASRFVLSGLALVATDVATHQAYGTCRRPMRGHLPLLRAAAVSAPAGA